MNQYFCGFLCEFMATQAGDLRQIGDIAMKYVAKKWGMIINNVHKKWDPPDFGDASPKNINWAGAPTSDYRKLQKKFFLTK